MTCYREGGQGSRAEGKETYLGEKTKGQWEHCERTEVTTCGARLWSYLDGENRTVTMALNCTVNQDTVPDRG